MVSGDLHYVSKYVALTVTIGHGADHRLFVRDAAGEIGIFCGILSVIQRERESPRQWLPMTATSSLCTCCSRAVHPNALNIHLLRYIAVTAPK